ncbi:hypothetical protein bb8_p06 [Bordetella phage vB_BbrP_BB8]|uniref:Uncharacterized protein n=1 Tax=Bordetella phage vB_BbrP_BB8 TaxID=2587820 RepID=A0A4Y5TQX4_9CAUD|nr:hypothetical protein bb8_p06 [Bordetella phage vB_BbrP_BB8]
MKTVVEFGEIGGRWAKHVCPTQKAGEQLATSLCYVLGIGHGLKVKRGQPRQSIQDSKHYVSLSLLDGAMRGDDAAAWRKNT